MMYNIYYSLADADWHGHDREVVADTAVQAFMEAVRLVREVLATRDFELLMVGEMEFVIWACHKCKGFLSVKEVGPET